MKKRTTRTASTTTTHHVPIEKGTTMALLDLQNMESDEMTGGGGGHGGGSQVSLLLCNSNASFLLCL